MWLLATVAVTVTVETPLAAMGKALFVALMGALAVANFALVVYIVYVAYSCLTYRAPEIVLVEDSPLPTRTAVTPTTRRRAPGSAMRGGKRRWRAHRKAVTLQYNPKIPNHCLYEAVLHASGVNATKRAIQRLREDVAKAVYQAYVDDEFVLGYRVKQVVAETGMNLRAYLADVRHAQWASPVEAHFATKVMNISMLLRRLRP